ncbi:MAG TPA: hypothetical protein VMT39_02470 [Candidatus Bathyarchaeia archaeon]|jgi:hypothetical protein|nr:hypothetical protein [Candidatus Bathyarchaeia archaeon]
MLWRIQAADDPDTGGELAWKLGAIKYGVVPAGYIQTFPLHGAMPLPLEPGKTYHVAAAGVPPFRRYFEIVGGKARWLTNPPEEPCFTKQNDQWVRVPCPSQN